jgi:hypothetical protein
MKIRVVSAAIFAVLVMSACGGSNASDNSQGSSAAVPAGPTTTAAATSVAVDKSAADQSAAEKSAAEKSAADKAAADKAAADKAAADQAAAEQAAAAQAAAEQSAAEQAAAEQSAAQQSAAEQSAAEQAAADQAATFGQYVREWIRHTSNLTINADHTGDMMMGSGCCNSIAFPMSYSLNSDGTLSGIVTGDSTYTGTSFNDTIFPVGYEFTMSIGQSEPNSMRPTSGPILLVSNPFAGQPGVTESQSVWCGDFYDVRCGA